MSAVTLALLKSELQLDTDAEDTYLQALLDGVEDWIESEFGILLSRQAVEESLWGGERILYPTKVPIASITSIELDGSTISSSLYTLRGNMIVHDDEWEEDFYDVTLSSGYSTVPARVKSLILALARRRYDARGGPKQESAGGHSVSWRPLVETDEMRLLTDLAGGPPC